MSQGTKILISSENIDDMEAEILAKNPKTAEAILRALPFSAGAHVWGNEIYFNIPVGATEENTQQEMEIGDVAFWPMGGAMCIFFGPTPVSDSDKPRAYSPVNLFAKVIGDARVFKRVREGDKILVKNK